MNDVIESLLARNRSFSSARFDSKLRIVPKAKTMIVGCVDPRVDPMDVLGLEPGETAILRNIGGRITPDLLLELDLLRDVVRAGGGDFALGWNLVVLHHTDCGIRRLGGSPEALGRFMGVAPSELEACHIHDPQKSVALDIDKLRAHPSIASDVLVTGLVYDVATGVIETVVPTAPLRA